ncbi:Ig-like domain-containing protein [Catenovulum sp. SM1970]|uniref:Ig-like domain-containing protein n=1 Tax=Marinifaba aquimaris TaxID=2741323 RepID=UPI0015730014|nr:Ig-like domain-containing protein [Marinifaba aquimaris]NTS75980.1 Ig-like domain-containing protein [Marinifaba aquimaris]
MPKMRLTWLASFLSLTLVACGGGGGIEGSSSGLTGGGSNSGTETSTDTQSTYALTANLTDAEGNVITQVSSTEPGIFNVTLTQSGTPVAGQLISVSSDLGVLQVGNGKILTKSDGTAKVTVRAGTQAGAGSFTATYNDTNTTINFESLGDDLDDVAGSSNYTLSLQLLEVDGVTSLYNVSDDVPGTLVATLLDDNNQPVPYRVIEFSSSLGVIFPATGTALTNEDGQAIVQLEAGDTKGATQAFANFGDVQANVHYATEGDDFGGEEPVDINTRLYDCNDANADSSNLLTCTRTNNVTLTRPGTLEVIVSREGSNGQDPIENILVTASTDNGNITPSNGRVLTNEQGRALISVFAGQDDGAGVISLGANGTDVTQTFQIGAANIGLSILTGLAPNERLAVGSTALITVAIIDESTGQPYSTPVTINFTSACASGTNPTATIDTQATTFNGIATATYAANGCEIDNITATAIAGTTLTASVEIQMEDVPTTSIQYEGISINGDNEARIISFPSSGQAEVAEVSFRVLDANSNPANSAEICFELSTDVGGIEIFPNTLEDGPVTTTNDGMVKAIVKSGHVATPVRVVASLAKPNGSCVDSTESSLRVRAVSDQLTVSSGIPDQNSFTTATEFFAVEAWGIAGVENPVTVYLSDRYNNPVPDGTAVSFVTSSGQIEPSCITENGACSLNWRSASPVYASGLANGFCDFNRNLIIDAGERQVGTTICVNNGELFDMIDPAYGKSAHTSILAYAVGEETFIDANGNGYFDEGEAFGDRDELFIDYNMDGFFCGRKADGSPSEGAESDAVCQSPGGQFEYSLDYNQNGTFDKADGLFNGITCSERNELLGICSRSLKHIGGTISRPISSGTPANPVIVNSNTGQIITSVNLVTTPSVVLDIFIVDENHNPMPDKTRISVSSSNGLLEGATEQEYSYGDPFSILLTEEKAGEGNEKFSGQLSIKITTEAGTETNIGMLTITDDR